MITQKTENNEIISDELKVVQTFDNYFVNIVPSSKINYDKDFFTDTYNQQISNNKKKHSSGDVL